MDTSKPTLEKLRKLYDKQREIEASYRDGMDAIAHEVDTLLSGGAGIGDVLKRLETHYAILWAVRYAPGWKPGDKGGYAWNYMADRAQWKRLIRTIGVEELELRAGNYLKDADDFYVRARHPFPIFVKNINRFTSDASERSSELDLSAPTVADCKHQPPCKDDQEHTRRKMAEMRAPK